MVKKKKSKKDMALKKALKEPPCLKNPYGIKCDRKLKKILKQDKSTKPKGVGAIQQRQNINIRIGDLAKAKRKVARKTVPTHRKHVHYTEAQRAAFAAPVMQQGSLLSQEQLSQAVGKSTYGLVRPDLVNTLATEKEQKSRAMRLSDLASLPPETAASSPAVTQQSSVPPSYDRSATFQQARQRTTAALTRNSALRYAQRAMANAAAAREEARGIQGRSLTPLAATPATPTGFGETDDARNYTFGGTSTFGAPAVRPNSLFSVSAAYQDQSASTNPFDALSA